MTYGAFLALALGGGLAFVAAGWALASRAGRWSSSEIKAAAFSLAGFAALAVVYTTPWDNFLVARHVWTYPPDRVWGIRLGWVPIEEYMFFVLQPLLTGSVAWFALRSRAQMNVTEAGPRHLRTEITLALAVAWGLALGLLASGWPHVRYLALILIWCLPPLGLQAAFGADLLWQVRQPVAAALTGTTAYLILADAWAIRSGIWNISPGQSLRFRPFGFPLEEALFFLATNALVVFGTAFVALPASRARWQSTTAGRAVTRAKHALGRVVSGFADPPARPSRPAIEPDRLAEGGTDP